MKRMQALHSTKRQGQAPPTLLFCLAFGLGGLLAFALASSLPESGNATLSAYIGDFVGSLREGALQKTSLGSAIFTVFRWPVLILLLSFTSFGVLGVPLVLFCRGFLFTFCVCAFAQVMGRQGVLFALSLLGVESLLSIPALFVLATVAYARSQLLRSKNRKSAGNTRGVEPLLSPRSVLCLIVLLGCTLWEWLLLPLLLSGAAQAL